MATFDETIASAYADPGGVIDAYKSLIQQSNIPTGAQLAPDLTQEQLDAGQLLQSGLGSYQPFLTAGAQSLQAAMGATGPQAMQEYMNPYTQEVVDATTTDLNRLFGQQQAAQAQRQIQTGSFAGSGTRGAVMDAELARAQGDALAKAVGGLRFRSAQDAQKAAQEKMKSAKAEKKQLASEPITEGAHYTYGLGDIVKNKNKSCPHYGSMGVVSKILDLPDMIGKLVTYRVTNNGPTYKAGDVLTKTGDQLTGVQYDD